MSNANGTAKGGTMRPATGDDVNRAIGLGLDYRDSFGL